MKLIPLRNFEGLKSFDVLKTVIERPPQGAGIEAIRAGCRVLDALDKAAGGQLLLEDADHAVLAKAVTGFTFGAISKDLLTIIDDVLAARAPDAETASGPDRAA
jgi:hypothetical protein